MVELSEYDKGYRDGRLSGLREAVALLQREADKMVNEMLRTLYEAEHKDAQR